MLQLGMENGKCDALKEFIPRCSLLWIPYSIPQDLLWTSLHPFLFCRGIDLEDVFDDEKFYKEMERSSVKCSERLFEKMTKPSLLLAENIGNMYTPSLYGGLASLLVK